ncbi:lysophospholipid acyltransferase family protein [Vibrio profundum]|uniref:lysophospholipid acyltransferase family protein n=1 Tax=Vibrio profundum TaxID=2910247 RepID=UPI003D10EAD1
MDMVSPFRLPRKTPFGIGEKFAERATGLHQLSKFYAQRPVGCDTAAFLRYTLQVLGIDYQITSGELKQVPTHGATIIVANHPLGCVEGVILAELLLMIRPDVKVLANHHLKSVPELNELFIGVDVFQGQQAHHANIKAFRAAYQHLHQQGLLLMFPAGEVSDLVDIKSRRVEDKPWSRSLSALIKKSKATVLPMYIEGSNSNRFYMAGKIHPMLRTLMLGRELLNKQNCSINIAIGDSIRYKEIHNLTDDDMVSYLRLNTYLLHSSVDTTTRYPALLSNSSQTIAAPLPQQALLKDIEHIPEDDHLLSSNGFEVYCTSAQRIPALIQEIGRQREINFRAVGEGTGRAIDLDQFDAYYQHLFVWDSNNQCLVGAYRLGLVDQIVQREGLVGLYSNTLFNYNEQFISKMGKSIELGRSVISGAYQKSLNALLLLWKGIATFVSRHPDYTHLFGPVSISNEYSSQARQLLTDAMTLHHYDHDRARYVSASHPLPERPQRWDNQQLSALGDLQLLSRVIARIDHGKHVPVLLRQYLALKGKLVCFNVDPNFNNALDGLIVVDLNAVPSRTLERYMGSEKAENYRRYHSLSMAC